ncbi:MAG: iron-sulfur cluster assembly scaffold protein [Candidatus Falkowbacteria bacterium]
MQYSKKVIEHFRNPHNQGRIKNADAIGQVGNPSCGDVMKIYLKVSKNKNGEKIIKDIKFETLGCAAAISVSSVLTVMVKGKTLAEALKITKDRIVKNLGGLPPIKVHCSMLGVEALHQAIEKSTPLNPRGRRSLFNVVNKIKK